MTMFRLAPLALLVATVAPAAANTVATDDSAPPPLAPAVVEQAVYAPARPAAERRLEGRVAMLLGGSDVGDANGFSFGFGGSVGYRVGDFTLRATLDHYGAGDGHDVEMRRRGGATRIGGALRYSLIHTPNNDRRNGDAAVELWGEAGYGWEHVAWDAGGVYERPSGELAVGFDVDARGERNGHGRRRHVGYFMAFRTFIGEGPEMTTPAMCGGPCTKATQPSRTDLSMFYELGMHWGH